MVLNLKNLDQMPHLQQVGGSVICGLLVVVGQCHSSLIERSIAICKQKATSHALVVCKPTSSAFHILDLAVDVFGISVGLSRHISVQDVLLYAFDTVCSSSKLFDSAVLSLAYPVTKGS